MVDISAKAPSRRTAVALGSVVVGSHVLELIRTNQVKKGDVLTVAQLAGIMGAKHTASLIPLCHPLPLSHVSVDLTLDEAAGAVNIEASASTTYGTGVEMEALMAVTVAALTIYDMCKAASREMVITGVRLQSKTGGVRGDYTRLG